MYDAFVAYFDAMVRSAAKADVVNYYRSASSGKYQAVFLRRSTQETPTITAEC